MRLRLATPLDAESITDLTTQLGYPSSFDEIARRLAAILSDPHHAIFIAEVDGMTVGWVHCVVALSLTADTPAEISGLVIDQNHRSRGIGRELLCRAEQWAREQKCPTIRLRSNITRDRAHSFYQNLGYDHSKTSKVFTKELAS
jgi:GNAT superfamily N-acetyltransferase